MFRRNSRLFSSISRHSRRAAKALLRTHRSDAKWMASYRERQSRVARWKSAFSFVPLNLSRFRAFWAAMTTLVARMIPTVRVPAAVSKGRNTNGSRAGLKLANAMGYENLEPRQLLAALPLNGGFESVFTGTTDDWHSHGGSSGQSGSVSDYLNRITPQLTEGSYKGVINIGGNLDSGDYGNTAFSEVYSSDHFSGVMGADFSLEYDFSAYSDRGGYSATLVGPSTSIVLKAMSSSEFASGTGESGTYSGLLPETGEFHFEFQVAAHDATNGGAIGARLYLDDVKVNSPPATTFDTLVTGSYTEATWPGMIDGTSTDPDTPTEGDSIASVDLTITKSTGETWDDGLGMWTAAPTSTTITGGASPLSWSEAFPFSNFKSSLGGGADIYTIVANATDSNGLTETTATAVVTIVLNADITAATPGAYVDNGGIAGGSDTLTTTSTNPTLTISDISASPILGGGKNIILDNTSGLGTPGTYDPGIDGVYFVANPTLGASFSSSLSGFGITSALPIDTTTYDLYEQNAAINLAAGQPFVGALLSDAIEIKVVPTLTFGVNETGPQEDLLPSITLINSQVTFSLDVASATDTTITYMIGMAGDTATAGVDYEVDPSDENFNFATSDPNIVPVPYPTLAGGAYMGTLIIKAGVTELKLDINMKPDLIYEGNEKFTVKVVSVDCADDASSPIEVTILDNEDGSEVSIMALDNIAAESFQFPMGNSLNVNGSDSGNPIFTDDIVSNDNGGTSVDMVQDAFEAPVGGGENSIYITQSLADALGTPTEEGLPNGGMFGANAFGPGAVLSYNDNNDGVNARLTSGEIPDVFRFDVLDQEYSEIHLFGAAADGRAQVSVRFYYTDGTSALVTHTFEDWRASISESTDLYNLVSGRDTSDTAGGALGDTQDVNIYGSIYYPNPLRTLKFVEVSVNTSATDLSGNPFDGGTFAFLGASGVTAKGTMGQYAVKLDVALDEDLVVDIDTTTGDAVNGLDYYLSVEGDPVNFPGVFDVDLPSTSTVQVTIPAGQLQRLVKLTVIDDMIIEGGFGDPGFGHEDATLTIDAISVIPVVPSQPTIDTTEATVTICDDDEGKVRIETINDAAEPDVSGKIKVTLDKKNTTQTGETTSSSDTLIMVDVGGEALPGVDYQTSITSTNGTSVATAQRVDGFWSRKFDPDIASPTSWVHNTVRSVATGGKEFYEVVLYADGKIRVDIDHTNGFDSHVRILGATAVFGNNNSAVTDGAGGSTSPLDSFGTTGVLTAGTYYIEVSRHIGPDTDPTNSARTSVLQAGDEYTLQISIENNEEGILIPAGQTMTMFNIDPIDDDIVEGGLVNNPGSEDVVFTMTGFKSQADGDIMVMQAMSSTTVDIVDDDDATLKITGSQNGHEDPEYTDPLVSVDGKFTLTLSDESSTDTKVKFKIDNFKNTPAPPTPGTEDIPDEATYGYDYTLSGTDSSGNPVAFTVFTSGANKGYGFITIPAGETEVCINVNVINDNFLEDDEFVRIDVVVSGDNVLDPNIMVMPAAAGIPTVLIGDEDLAEVAINNTVGAVEGGQKGVFTVSLTPVQSPSNPVPTPRTSDSHTDVEFMLMFADTAPQAQLPAGLEDGSIPDPSDYFHITVGEGNVISYDSSTGIGVVRIPAYSASGKILVTAVDDTMVEPTEWIKIKLTEVIDADSDVVGVKAGFDSAEIPLYDNDEAFVKIERIHDGKEPDMDGQFKVTLVNAAGQMVTTGTDVVVYYDTLDSSTAQAGAAPGDGFNIDYETLPGEVTILAGDSMAFINVHVLDDIVNEFDETVDVQLTGTDNPDQISVQTMNGMDQATVLIQDNDSVVVMIEASDAMAREASDHGQFKLSLVNPNGGGPAISDGPIVVNVDVVLGMGPNADAIEGEDYELYVNGELTHTVTFGPFETMAFVDVVVLNDAIPEWSTEQVKLAVSYVSSNWSLCSTVTADDGTAIVDIKADPAVTVDFYNMMGTEGSDTNPSFIVQLPEISGGPMDGQYNLADGDLTVTYTVFVGDPVNYGTPGADYTTLTGTVVIPQADGYAIFEVEMLDDMTIERDEYVSIMLESVAPTVGTGDPNDADVKIQKDLYGLRENGRYLSTIDPNTGMEQESFAISMVDGRTNGDIDGGEGLAVDPTTWKLYAVLEFDGTYELVTIDPATGLATTVGVLGTDGSDPGDFNIDDIAFDASGNLFGITNNDAGPTSANQLFSIDKNTAAVTTASAVLTGSEQTIAYSPVDMKLHHVANNGNPGYETLGPATGIPLWGSSPSSFSTNVTAMVHAQTGNFDGDFFFASDENGYFYTVTVADFDNADGDDDPTTGTLEYSVENQGLTYYNEEGLAFLKSNAAVKIKDNDSGFIEVKAKQNKGDDLQDGSVDTGFNVTIKKFVDGQANDPTISSTDTTVKFMVMDTATPFLGDQTEDEGQSSTGQDIDTYGSMYGGYGGANNWSLNGAGVPHTVVNGVGDATSDMYTFTVLNDGDAVDIMATGPVSAMQLEMVGGGVVGTGGSSISIAHGVLSAGTYKLTVVASVGADYSVDVAVENHLIADYVLTSDNELVFDESTGLWCITIPAGEESVMVNVEVFNDTQIEETEEVSLWLKTVSDGDEDISTGQIYFAQNEYYYYYGPGNNPGIGRVDVGGSGLTEIVDTQYYNGYYSAPWGVSIDQAEGKVYWSEGRSDYYGYSGYQTGIWRSNLDGSDVELIYGTPVSPHGLQVVGDQVYWVDNTSAEIFRINKDGSGSAQLIVDVNFYQDAYYYGYAQNLTDIAVDNVHGRIYWTSQDSFGSRISSSKLDGTDVKVVLNNTDVYYPSSIDLDVAGGKMYWSDEYYGVRRANLDGTSVESVAYGNYYSAHGVDLDLMNGFVYWTEGSDSSSSIYRANLNGPLPTSGELVSSTLFYGYQGYEEPQHLDLLIPTMIHATVEICDHDLGEVYVVSDNTEMEAMVDPASENPLNHKDIVLGLRDPVTLTPVTSQTYTQVNYTYKAESTATNGSDHAFLPGSTYFMPGQSSAVLFNSLNNVASVFVYDDNSLEGTEYVKIGLDAAVGDSDITIVAPNVDMENMGVVKIIDNESAEVHFGFKEGDRLDGKERDGSVDEPLAPGKFTLSLTRTSTTDTTVTFMVAPGTDAELNDYTLSTMNASNMLTDLGGGMWSIKILKNQKSVMVNVNVNDDNVVEVDENLNLKIVSVVSGNPTANIGIGLPNTETVTIFDDDVAKVIIVGTQDAMESTQPGEAPGQSGEFKVSLVDLDGNMITSETSTTVKVDVVSAVSGTNATYGQDYIIPGAVESSPGSGDWHVILTFAPGESMKTLTVQLLGETPPDGNPNTPEIDMGEEFVKLMLDPNYAPIASGGDGVIGDNQIQLDVMVPEGEGQAGYIDFVWDDGSPCIDFQVPGMGMNMDEIQIVDETFKVNIFANEENGSEPGTLPLGSGENGQFQVTINSPWNFGDTIVNYTISGTATTASLASGALNPADYEDLVGYDPSNPDFVLVSIDGQVVIPAGADHVNIDVTVLDDQLIELLENVTVTLQGFDYETTTGPEGSGMVENAPVGVYGYRCFVTDFPSATVYIADDDTAVVTPNVVQNAMEPDNGVSDPVNDNGQITIKLLEDGTPIISDQPTLVSFAITGDAILGGSTLAGADYKLVLDASTDGGEGFVLTYNEATGLGTVLIPAGESCVKINVMTLDDIIIEDDESVILTVTAVSNAVNNQPDQPDQITIPGSPDNAVEVTIADKDEGLLKLVKLDVSGKEPGGLNPDASFSVYLVDADGSGTLLVSDSDTDVTYEVKDSSTATPDVDYVALSGMVQIPAFTGGLGVTPTTGFGGDGQGVIEVHVLNDLEVELTETVAVNATGVADSEGVRSIELHSMPSMLMDSVNILDNDTALVSIKSDSTNADNDVREGNPGAPNNGKFEVLMNKISTTDTVVTFMVVDAETTATYGAGVGGDYTLSGATTVISPIMGTVTILAGQQSAIIDLTTTNDLTQESLENVTVKVVSTNNSVITVDGSMAKATISIKDDDFPTFTVSGVGGAMAMADEGDGYITFEITLSEPIDEDVSVFLELVDNTATGYFGDGQGNGTGGDTSTSDQDYDRSNTNPSVTFLANGANGLVQTIMVDITDDIWVENHESFFANMIVDGASTEGMTAGGLEINVINGEGWIKDNDKATFTIFEKGSTTNSDPTVTEGTDSPNPYNNGSPTTAVQFEVELSNPIDTDVDVAVSFGGGTATGGSFNVTAGGAITGGAASYGTDYRGTTQTITFNSGDYGSGDRIMVTVPVIQDLIVEGGPTVSPGVETFVASLTASTADLETRSYMDMDDSTATIVDDDSATVNVMVMGPANADSDYEASEPGHDPNYGNGAYTITQTNPSQTVTTVKFTMSGDAILGTDYTLESPGNNLTDLGSNMFSIDIAPGQTEVVVTLVAIDDAPLIEDDEYATMTLNALLGSPDADITIDSAKDVDTVRINNGDRGELKIAATIPMGVEGSMDGKFTITLDEEGGAAAVSDTDTVVHFQIALGSGQATIGADYSLTAPAANMLTYNSTTGVGSVKILEGESMVMLNVVVVDDVETEDMEDVTITITGRDGNTDIKPAESPDNSAVVTIKDNADGFFVKVLEVHGGKEPGVNDADDGLFEFTLVDADGNPTVVPAGSTTSGYIIVAFEVGKPTDTATVGEDYATVVGEVQIFEGSGSALVSIPVLNDFIVEPTETVSISILDILDSTNLPITTLNGEGVAIHPDCSMDTLDILDNDTFAVLKVKVGSTDWTTSFNNFVDSGTTAGFQGYSIPTGGAQDDTVPWTNINTVLVQFNDDVDVSTLTTSSFVLHGLNSTPTFAASTPISYDAATRTAKLSLSGYILNDKLRVEVLDTVKSAGGVTLDGDWTNNSSSFASGNGSPGTDFNFNFNVLPGDATHSTNPATAVTNAGDTSKVFGLLMGAPFGGLTTTTPGYEAFSDVNGSGIINAGDTSAIFGILMSAPFGGLKLPVGSPGGFSSGLSGGTDGLSGFVSTGLQLDSGLGTDGSDSQTKSLAIWQDSQLSYTGVTQGLAGSIADGKAQYSAIDSAFGDDVKTGKSGSNDSALGKKVTMDSLIEDFSKDLLF